MILIIIFKAQKELITSLKRENFHLTIEKEKNLKARNDESDLVLDLRNKITQLKLAKEELNNTIIDKDNEISVIQANNSHNESILSLNFDKEFYEGNISRLENLLNHSRLVK
jgi:organic radical activating enzyme